jgi:hypothetical protein
VVGYLLSQQKAVATWVLKHESRTFVSNTAKAEVFIKHYAAFSCHKSSRAECKKDQGKHIRFTEDRRNPACLDSDSNNFLMDKLKAFLKAGKAKGTEGKDGLAPRFLKNLGEVAKDFLLDTFNKSSREGVCSQSWRDAVINFHPQVGKT